MSELDRLIARAKGLPRPGTPGPWIVWTDEGDPSWEVISHDPESDAFLAYVAEMPAQHASRRSPADRAAIAALPEYVEVVEALVAEVSDFEERVGPCSCDSAFSERRRIDPACVYCHVWPDR